MIVLGLESSAAAASAAVLKDGKIISECYLNNGLTHSATLLPLAESALKSAGITAAGVDIFAVAYGPGSFTGIRIGVGMLKGLCFPEDKPCYGISTLEAMAYLCPRDDTVICPVMDARCSQVYNALFTYKEGKLVRLSPDRAIKLEELAADETVKNNMVLLLGDGVKITSEYFSSLGAAFTLPSQAFAFQHASGVATAAYEKYIAGEKPVSAGGLNPLYLRQSQAERELGKKRAEKP